MTSAEGEEKTEDGFYIYAVCIQRIPKQLVRVYRLNGGVLIGLYTGKKSDSWGKAVSAACAVVDGKIKSPYAPAKNLVKIEVYHVDETIRQGLTEQAEKYIDEFWRLNTENDVSEKESPEICRRDAAAFADKILSGRKGYDFDVNGEDFWEVLSRTVRPERIYVDSWYALGHCLDGDDPDDLSFQNADGSPKGLLELWRETNPNIRKACDIYRFRLYCRKAGCSEHNKVL